VGGGQGDEAMALDAGRNRDAADGEQDDDGSRGRLESGPGAGVDLALGAYVEVCRAVHDQHGETEQSAKQAERVQQRKKRAGVIDLQGRLEVKGHAEKQIAESNAENYGGAPAGPAGAPG